MAITMARRADDTDSCCLTPLLLKTADVAARACAFGAVRCPPQPVSRSIPLSRCARIGASPVASAAYCATIAALTWES